MQAAIVETLKSRFAAGTPIRKSKDNVKNNNGKAFIQFCNDYGLVVTNGMTKGDEKGEFTFVSGIGSSTNDICAVSQELLQHIDNFIVDSRIWSDHLQLH